MTSIKFCIIDHDGDRTAIEQKIIDALDAVGIDAKAVDLHDFGRRGQDGEPTIHFGLEDLPQDEAMERWAQMRRDGGPIVIVGNPLFSVDTLVERHAADILGEPFLDQRWIDGPKRMVRAMAEEIALFGKPIREEVRREQKDRKAERGQSRANFRTQNRAQERKLNQYANRGKRR